MKNILVLSLFLGLAVPIFALVAIPEAKAACSYNGFLHSNGKCGGSYKNAQVAFGGSYGWDDDDEDDDDDNNFGHSYGFGFGYGFLGGLGGFGNIDEERLDRVRELLALIEELRALLRGTSIDQDILNVTTRSATNIDEDSATVRGRIDLDDEDTAEVWFEYGTDRFDLDDETSKQTLDENDDDFSEDISGLDGNRIYYFRALAEDEDGDIDRGVILSFRTESDGTNDEDPDVDTEAEQDVTDTDAELNGSVDMHDFENGRVFFIYGEDENQVEDVENEYETYDAVDEDGEDLKKELVDSDLDDAEQYSLEVEDLDADTEHFFSICVQYEDENNDDTIICGGVGNFTTEE